MSRNPMTEQSLLQVDDDSQQCSVWELYHENSKLHLWDVNYHARIAYVNWSLDVQDLVRDAGWRYACAERVALPRTFRKSEKSFDDIVLGRRSVRAFSERPLALADVAKLLYFCMGETAAMDIIEGERVVERPLRVCPSGGALFPIECYLLPFNVVGLERDHIYHYDVAAHQLARGSIGCSFDALEHAAFPGLLQNLAGLLVFTAVFQRSAFKYGDRSYRFILQETGHIAQNVLLTAAGLGLDSVVIGGFVDDTVNEMLHLDGLSEAAMYMVAFGNVQGGTDPDSIP